jgi:hypothetical protein
MPTGVQSVLATAFMPPAMVSSAATSTPQTVQASSVDKLTRASACAASADHVTTGDNVTTSVENDGGWCWQDTHERSIGGPIPCITRL